MWADAVETNAASQEGFDLKLSLLFDPLVSEKEGFDSRLLFGLDSLSMVSSVFD